MHLISLHCDSLEKEGDTADAIMKQVTNRATSLHWWREMHVKIDHNLGEKFTLYSCVQFPWGHNKNSKLKGYSQKKRRFFKEIKLSGLNRN